MKAKLLTLLFAALLPYAALRAQLPTGQWLTHSAYHDATAVVTAGNMVYGLYDGHLMSYNPDTEEVRTYSRLQGLSGDQIRSIAYSATCGQLVVLYETPTLICSPPAPAMCSTFRNYAPRATASARQQT